MSNYTATVVKIDNIRPHSNADRLVCTSIFGNNVIVGKDTNIGDIGLFFPLESQLGEDFALINDLIRRKDPETGKTAGGMFDKVRRVRAQTFRGEKSMGFFAPLSYLERVFESKGTPVPTLSVGDELDVLQGVEISRKYVVPFNNPSRSKTGKVLKGKKKVESRIIPELWHFHFDTSQFGKNTHRIERNSRIAITWKFHGTSAIVGYTKVKRKLPWYEKVLQRLGVAVVDTEWDYVYSSRKVIKNDNKQYNHYYDADVWSLAGESFKGKLRKGETVYMELVGYTPSGNFIQKGYDYKVAPGKFEIHVYRMTMTNDDGQVVELPWDQVKYRCMEMQVSITPEIFYGPAKNFLDVGDDDMPSGYYGQALHDYLAENYVYDQNSQWCANKVPEEGVVIRLENGDGIENFKMKAFAFYQYESKQLDSGEVDVESLENPVE